MGKFKIFNTKILSLTIASIMLFNLTAPVFAAPQIATKEQKENISRTLTNAYNRASTSPSDPNNQNPNLRYYEQKYESALEGYSKILEKYKSIDDVFWATYNTQIQTEKWVDDLNNKYEQTINQYNESAEFYLRKLEELGGIENIEQKYLLYQRWLDLKPQIDARKAELDEIINTGDKAAVQEAKKELKEYQDNFYSRQTDFDKFKQDFEALERAEETLTSLEYCPNGIEEEAQSLHKSNYNLKQSLLNSSFLSEEKELTPDSDWNQILNIIQEKLNNLEPELKKAQQNLQNAEKAHEEAYKKDLENRLSTSFQEALEKTCQLFSQQAQEYATPKVAKYGKIYGRYNVEVEPGSNFRENYDVAQYQVFLKQKQAYKQCINPSWDEEGLKTYNAGITMEELANVRYGDYLFRYDFNENELISDGEAIAKAQELAKKTVAVAILDSTRDEKGEFIFSSKVLELYYTVVGDNNQSITLQKFLKQDWENKGYGTIKHFNVPNKWDEETGHIIETENLVIFEPNEKTKDTQLPKHYVSQMQIFSSTQRVTDHYFIELNNLLIKIMTFLAEDSNGTKNIDDYLGNTLNIPLTQDFLNIDESLIQQKLDDMNKTFTNSEKVEFAKQTIKKKSFDPLMFLLSPSSQTFGRNTALVRERRAAVAGFDLNESDEIKAILFLNAITRNTHNISTEKNNNLKAWNLLALRASYKTAEKLLKYMTALGHQTSIAYEEVPSKYYQELEDSYHDLGKELFVDLAILFPIQLLAKHSASLSLAYRAISKRMSIAALKTFFNSNLRRSINLYFKRNIGLINTRKDREIFNAMESARERLSGLDKTVTAANRVIEFKNMFTGETHSIGVRYGAQNALIPSLKQRIHEMLGIRPSAAQTSRIFNTKLTKQRYDQLKKDLDRILSEKSSKEKPVSKYGLDYSKVYTNAKPHSRAPRHAISLKKGVYTILTSLSLFFNPINFQKSLGEITNKTKAKATTEILIDTAPTNLIADVSKAEITVGTQETATVVTNNSVKQRASKYLVGKDDLVNAATKRKNDKISFFKKMNIKTSKRQPKQNRHPYPKKKVDEKTGFLRDMENKNVKPTGKTYTKPFSYDAQNVINQALEPYKQQGAILQMNDLHTIVRQEVAPDGLLHGIDGIPKKINVNTYNEFYTKLTEAINAGNSNAQKFFDKYLKNLLTPDSMVVFDTNISIPGSRNPMKIAMSVEKLAAAQSNKNIVILRTNDGLKMVNAHQLKNLGYQIEKLVKGNISAVFQLNNNRLMVITEWDKNNHAIRLILERDERKGVNVIVSAYKGSREDVVKKLSRELYKPLYVDEKTASIINGL